MTAVVKGARYVIAAAMLAAIAWSLARGIDAGTFKFFNFFGFFTIQNNLIGALALLVAAPLTGLARPAWIEYLRACAATYLVIVVTVYWTLLAPTTEDSVTEWTNLVLHALSGIALLADWLIEGPRARLPLRTVWIVLAYPFVWVVVVLIRGATDGWFPYPFLDPANGYASIAVVVGGIFVAGIVVGGLLFSATRWRVVVPAVA